MLLSDFFALAADDLKLNTVVIDAGHGGKDPGAVSADRRSYEKNFTLEISKKLAERIRNSCPDVKVVLTRNNDTFVSLNDRAVIANRENAKLFISIHINASRNTSASGYSVHVLGQSSVKDRDLLAYNMNVCKRENSVILLEEDYSTKYQGFDPNDEESYIFMMLMQNSNLEQSLDFAQYVSDEMLGGPISNARGVWQNPFYVLWKTSMPAVLVELGFISNASDLAILKTDADDIADRLCSAFVKYKFAYEASLSGEKQTPPAASPVPASSAAAPAASPVPAPASEPVAASTPAAVAPVNVTAAAEKTSDVRYGVQIFAGKSLLYPNDKQFLGYAPEIIGDGTIYRYVIGVSSDLQTTKENYLKIKKRYPNSFIIKLVDGVISRL